MVLELDKKGLLEVVFLDDKKFDLINKFDTRVELISSSLVGYLSDSVTSDGVFAICRIPKVDSSFSRCLVLDRIQDPTNLGAIIRSACAFGFDTIFSLNSVYPYSFKAIRSSMGQVFNVNMIDVSFEDLIEYKNKYKINFVVADMDGEDISTVNIESNKNIAVIIGNEGQGVSEELLKLSNKTVSIPMRNNVESLNASVSAGIIMFLLK